jgi:flagellar hook-associated protein 3 FlgL
VRISTSEVFANGIAAIQRAQGTLAHTQQQLASGRRILSPSDDPGGAVAALHLRDGLSSLDQYERNAVFAAARLSQQETTLASMGDVIARVRELTVRAANATETNESRRAIAVEVRELSATLLDAANTRDPNGEFIFAGFQSATQPFVRASDGTVAYQGDANRREVALSADRRMTIGDSGLAFMSIAEGPGAFAVEAGAANSGTAYVDESAAAGYASSPVAFTITFTAPDAYEIHDADGNVHPGSFAPGEAIEFEGVRVVIHGTPDVDDTFAVGPAVPRSVFDIVDALTAALLTPVTDNEDRARLHQATDRALASLDNALSSLFDLRATTGTRMRTVDRHVADSADQKLHLQTALSTVEDIDYAEAISRFNLQQVALQAAQQTYVQLSRLSLFDYIR